MPALPCQSSGHATYAAILLALVSSGCGSRDDLGRVSGSVTLDGEPLEEAFVQFEPTAPGGSTSYGRTDGNGNYSLMFSRSAEGASLGENRVRITTFDLVDGGDRASLPEKVPARYNRDSELVVTVEPGSNTFDFPLESAGEVIQPRVVD